MRRCALGLLVAGCSAMPDTGAVRLSPGLAFRPSFCEQTQALSVVNGDSRPRALSSIRRVSGAPVRAAPFLDEPGAPFELVPMTQLTAGEVTSIPVVFRPRGPGPVDTTVEFDFEGQRLTTTLSATGLSLPMLPDLVDFGAVALGDSAFVPLELEPPLRLEATGTGFFPSDDETGLVFSPSTVRTFGGTATVTGSCSARTLRLLGHGVDSALTATPTSVWILPTPTGAEGRAELRLRNATRSPVPLRDFVVLSSGTPTPLFSLEGLDGGVLVLPSGRRTSDGGWLPGEAALGIVFTPLRVGRVFASVQFATPLRTQPSVSVPLSSIGGAPDIEVSPTSIEFAPVSTQDRQRLRVQNKGTMWPDGLLNLTLGRAAMPPAFEVVPISGVAGSVSVAFSTPPFDVATGLLSGQHVDLDVIALPGPAVHHVRIFSNDPDEPVVTVVVTTR